MLLRDIRLLAAVFYEYVYTILILAYRTKSVLHYFVKYPLVWTEYIFVMQC